MLDDALPKGEFDFVDDIAAPIPIRVLGHILGVPEEHHDRLIELSDRLINNNDPELATVTADSPESDAYRLAPFRSPDAQEIIDLGHDLFDARRRQAQDDVMSLLVHASPDGGPYTQRELDVNFVTLVVAGNETTRSAMAHGMLALIEHPEQCALLRERPELIPQAVDEMIRVSSPVWHFRRTAMADVELRGQTIKAGDKVVVWFASANRDPDVFPDPHRFDVTRAARNLHAAFGRGGPTSASAPTSPGSSCGCCSRSSAAGGVDRARRPAAPCALELRERAEGDARARHAEVAPLRGRGRPSRGSA